MLIEKWVNIPIRKFYKNIYKHKNYKNQCLSHYNNHCKRYTNAKCIKLPNYRYKENEYENLQNIPNFFKDILKKDSLDVRFCKIDGIYT